LADVTKANRMLGFCVKVGIEEGLRCLVAWRREVLQRGLVAAYEGTPAAVVGEAPRPS
jgi:hypothetical protein